MEGGLTSVNTQQSAVAMADCGQIASSDNPGWVPRLICAATVALVSAGSGSWVVRNFQQSPLRPFVLAMVSGLLVGIAMLVVLPDVIEVDL